MGSCLDTDIDPKNLCHETHIFRLVICFPQYLAAKKTFEIVLSLFP